ncbi:MAG: phosphotransferase [Parvibaculum sp.]|nr:phosphotransferase [Parvibaculum sp.]
MSELHEAIAGDVPGLPAGPWVLLGEGLWGSVHDLGDGSVLKLVRRNGGLGTGESKHYRETAALRLLDGLQGSAPRLPRLLDAGRFENAYGFSGPPLAGWLRLEKLEGKAVDEGRLYALKAEERERLKEMWAAADAPRVFLHGDLNLSNVLSARGLPVALVDFAEAGTGFPEEDFRHFDNPGPMRDAIFRSYAAVSGRAIDMHRFRMAVAVNATCSLAIGSNSGHPREGMRRVSFLDEALRQAGIEA